MTGKTEHIRRATEIFISRNDELQRELKNFHVHPGGLDIQARREDYVLAAFARAAEDRGTTIEDYAIILIAKTPGELEQLRNERRKDIASSKHPQALRSE